MFPRVVFAIVLCCSAFVAELFGADFVWMNASGGLWSEPANWFPNGLPGAADRVFITNAGSYSIALDVDATNVSVTLGGEAGTQSLQAGGRRLSVVEHMTVLPGGMLTLQGAGALAGPGVLTNAGVLNVLSATNHARLVNEGLVVASQSVLGFPSVFGASVLVRTGATFRVESGAVAGRVSLRAGLTNEGLVELAALAPASCTLELTVGRLINSPGGLITTGDANDAQRIISGEIENRGVLATTAPGELILSRSAAVHQNRGTMVITNGSLSVVQSDAGAALVNFGAIQISPDRALTINGGDFRDFTGGITGGGALAFTNVVARFDADHTTLAGGLIVAGVSSLFGPGTIRNSGAMVVQSSIVHASIENLGLLMASQVSAGFPAVFAGPLAVRPGSVFRAVSAGLSGVVRVESGFTNEGLVEISVGSSASSTLEVSAGTLVNAPGGRIATGAGSTIPRVLAAELDNQGELITTAAGTLSLSKASAAHRNTGSIVVTNGNLTINQSGGAAEFGNSGAIQIGPGRTLSVSGGAFHHLSGVMNGSGALSFTGARVFLVEDYTTSAGGLTLASASSLRGPGTVRNVGAMTVRSSTNFAIIENLGLLAASQVNNGVPAVFAGSVLLRAGSIFRAVAGSVHGTVRVESGITNEGMIEVTSESSEALSMLEVSGGALVNAPGGLLTTGTNITTGGRFLTAELRNHGMLLTTAPAALTLNNISAAQVNFGSLVVSNGDLIVSQSGASPSLGNEGSMFVHGGRVMTVSGGVFENLPGGEIRGVGTLACSATLFTNRGTIHPGSPAGQLNVAGTMTTLDSGEVAIELAGVTSGAGYDRLTVSGVARLGGTLSVELTDGFAPVAGNVFTVLTAGTLAGEFASFHYPSNEYRLALEYAQGAVNVRVIDTPPLIAPLPDVEVIEGETMTVPTQVIAVGAAATSTNFTLLGAPSGASVDAAGVVRWTTGETNGPGVFLYTIRLTDGESDGLAAFETFLVTVRESNVPPVLVLPPDQTIDAMSLLNIQATATDADVPANPLTFELLSGPSGMAMSVGGWMTWKPGGGQTGVHEIVVRVLDENLPAVNATQLATTNRFTVTVASENLSVAGWRAVVRRNGEDWPAPRQLAVRADDFTPHVLEAEIYDTNGVLIVRPDVRFAFPESGASMELTAAMPEGGNEGTLAASVVPNGVAGFYSGRLLVGTSVVATVTLHNVEPGLAVGGQLSDTPAEDMFGRARRFREFLDGGQSYLLIDVGAAWSLSSQQNALDAISAQRALATRGVRLRYVPVLEAGLNSNAPSSRSDALDWAQKFPFVDPVLHFSGQATNAIAAAVREIRSLENVLPTSLLVAPDGRILHRQVGGAGAAEIIQRVGVAADLVPPMPRPASLGVSKSDEMLVMLRVGEFRFSDIGVNRVQRTYGPISIVADERLLPLPGLTNSASLVDTFSLHFDDLGGLNSGKPVEMDFLAGWSDGYQRHLSNGVANVLVRTTNETGSVSAQDVDFVVPVTFDGTRLAIRFTTDQLRDAVTEFFSERDDFAGGSNVLARLVGFSVEVGVRTDFAIVPAVRGQVLDNKTLQPLPGTVVRLLGPGTNRTTVADVDGRFQFARLGPGMHSLSGTRPNFVFSAPSFVVSGTSIVITQNLSALRTAFDLAGRVTDCVTGAGVPNVPVYVSGLNRPLSTDADGRYALNGVRVGGVVQVQPAGFGEFTPRAFRLIAPSRDPEVVNFCLTPLATLSGRVRDSNGAGVAAVEVAIEEPSGGIQRRVTSAPGGEFRFDWLGTSNYTVTPTRAGFTFAPASMVLPNAGTNMVAEFVATPDVMRNDRLSVADGRALHLLDADGTARMGLQLSNVVSAAISPDGTRVAFDWYEGSTSRVSVIHVDGSGLARLVADSFGDVAFPTWAPDGAQVAFVRAVGADTELWRVGTNGSGASRLATNAMRLPVSWSPDGASVAYAGIGAGGFGIFTVGTNGGTATRWTTNGASAPRSIAWSPDGTRLAFVRREGSRDNARVLRLADRSEALLVSNALAVCWSPDGSRIGIRRGAEILHMPAGGGAATQLGIGGRLSNHSWGRKPLVPTAKGSNVVNMMGNGLIAFDAVSIAGDTSFNPIAPSAFVPPPSYVAVDGAAYDLTTTASASGTMTICVRVAGVDDPVRFARLRVLHGEGGTMVDRTVLPPDFATRTVCASVGSLSPFLVVEQNDAALPAISGLVADDLGAPVMGALVALSGSVETTAVTDGDGHFSFPNLSLGVSYSVQVAGSRHLFAPGIVTFQELSESVDLFFVGTPKPLPAAPLLRVGADARFHRGQAVSWAGAPGAFTLQSSATLEPAGWSEAFEVEVPLDGEVVVPIGVDSPWHFYRLFGP